VNAWAGPAAARTPADAVAPPGDGEGAPAADVAVDLRRLSPLDAVRLGRIGLTLTRNGVLSTARRGPFLVLRPRDQGLTALAAALRKSFVQLGPTFVKLGQLFASSPGVLPSGFSEEFRQLLDDVPPERPATVRRVVEEGLGAPLGTIFSRFDERPRAAASIAQVHRARLRDGRLVAVKVRRPGLRSNVERDLRLLKLFALPLERAGSLGRTISPVAMAEDFATTLTLEMDLRVEADRMRRFGHNLHLRGANPRIHVPQVIDGMVGESVLVMSFIEGHPIDVAAGRFGRDALFDVGIEAVRAWLESALRHGLFHGDVHAANIFYTPQGDIALLDFGIMGELGPSMRGILCHALPRTIRNTVLRGDPRGLADVLLEAGLSRAPVDEAALARDVGGVVQRHLDRPMSEISIPRLLIDVVGVAVHHQLTLPRELILVARQLALFEGYARMIAPDVNIFTEPEIVTHLLSGLVDGRVVASLPRILGRLR
jgi:predicted unusual protein kinase regulating ubiquinone biosynthesis (AarF/ABC1/UbiB family)